MGATQCCGEFSLTRPVPDSGDTIHVNANNRGSDKCPARPAPARGHECDGRREEGASDTI